ncbi:MAG TPA: hypothetical protein VKM55_05350 [Candidatus Lokiarchaeia archaeon]|nr:hypothetical protein [Candidatus Lokiarchaeia archaeon]
MKSDGLKMIAGSQDYPLVRQTLNTCGLASLAMIFLHHSEDIDDFLKRVYISKYKAPALAKIKANEHDAAILWSEAFLLLKARASRRIANWLKRTASEFIYDDFKLDLDLRVDEMSTRQRDPAMGTAAKYFKHGTIRKQFVRFYMEQYKTQLELRILAAMFGFGFIGYPGDTLGNLYFSAKDQDVSSKLEFMRGILEKQDHAVLMGHGQSHWMVTHSLFGNGTAEQETMIGINDPLGSSTRLAVESLDSTYLFYFFKFNENACNASINFLETILRILSK